jgi:hypothetical protein
VQDYLTAEYPKNKSHRNSITWNAEDEIFEIRDRKRLKLRLTVKEAEGFKNLITDFLEMM